MSVGKRAFDIMRAKVNQEWDRLQSLGTSPEERELQEAIDRPTIPVAAEPSMPHVTTPERARQVLGIDANADFATTQAAFERLVQRSNPANFPEGSREARQAADIQRQIQQAYSILTENMDSTERRFRSLEID